MGKDSLIVEDFSMVEDAFTVKDIQVKGLQRVSAASVFAALPIEIGA